ncbi:hypothetical protein H4N58_00190 [Mumia sp. ZJ1417]|uniref:hypothetical protein n=1 Tax=Mumia sp. ZJ1417 TaxID=2708082 RepID=UPI0014224A6C|nr:hypothetical protein [Mumia sp. ZJ1417]QMW66456.1 hypothetical protein H4N58_00190 [Mumia sp. ZJ1417]
MTPAPDPQATFDALSRVLAPTPWQVTRRDSGVVDVQRDLADARWHGALAKAGLKKDIRHELRFTPDRGTYVITDVATTVRWSAGISGAPHASWRKDVHRGRQLGRTRSTEDVRSVITAIAREHGWRERLPVSAWVGIVVGGVALVAGLVVAVLALVLGL